MLSALFFEGAKTPKNLDRTPVNNEKLMPPQPPILLPSGTVAQTTATPFALEAVRRTVLQLANPFGQKPPVSDSEAALAAMQRLVEIIDTLRSSQPSFLEGLLPQSPEALETLLPYVSEEAYDVLDALRIGEASDSLTVQPASITAIAQQNSLTLSSPHSLITIDALIPSLLWQIARSDYSVMHLIEGVRGQCWQSQGWAAGMLRLVVMLELEAPTVRWCFDLATGQPAEGLLESIAIVQADEQALPVQQSAYAGAATALGDASCQVEYQLQAILQLLQIETFGLGDFLQGIAVALLQPGLDWQSGELRLQFGFEFSAQVPEVNRSEDTQRYGELIDAAQMEDTAGINPLARPFDRAIADSTATTQIPVVGLKRSLHPAALVRVSASASLESYLQQTTRQQLAQSLQQHDRHLSQDEHGQLISILQAALITLSRQTGTTGIGLLQPTLLLDELVPRLLWSLTSHTYEMMQWLGGLPAQVLQPEADWQQGTLRLLAVLQITATDLDYTLDLSTGRSTPVNAVPLPAAAIVQASASTLCQQPTLLEKLTTQLQQFYEGVPESKLLLNGLAIDWLEDVEQDWQSGLMTLNLSLVFLADSR